MNAAISRTARKLARARSAGIAVKAAARKNRRTVNAASLERARDSGPRIRKWIQRLAYPWILARLSPGMPGMRGLTSATSMRKPLEARNLRCQVSVSFSVLRVEQLSVRHHQIAGPGDAGLVRIGLARGLKDTAHALLKPSREA